MLGVACNVSTKWARSMLLTGMKLIGSGLATISIGGAGVGIGTV